MVEKCPVCKNNIKINDRACSVCGFTDLHREFITKEDGELWIKNVVEPYKKKYEESLSKGQYNAEGYDRMGYDRNGYDKEGYDRSGYNKEGFYKLTGLNREGYDKDGYDKNGYNKSGYDRDGFSKLGYNKDGYDRFGFNQYGIDKDGYNKKGYKNGYNRDGFDAEGYDHTGYNRLGYNKDGYTVNGFDQNGFNRQGYDKEGYDKEGFDRNGMSRFGAYREEFDEDGFHKFTGFDVWGYDRNGYNNRKIHKDGHSLRTHNFFGILFTLLTLLSGLGACICMNGYIMGYINWIWIGLFIIIQIVLIPMSLWVKPTLSSFTAISGNILIVACLVTSIHVGSNFAKDVTYWLFCVFEWIYKFLMGFIVGACFAYVLL